MVNKSSQRTRAVLKSWDESGFYFEMEDVPPPTRRYVAIARIAQAKWRVGQYLYWLWMALIGKGGYGRYG